MTRTTPTADDMKFTPAAFLLFVRRQARGTAAFVRRAVAAEARVAELEKDAAKAIGHLRNACRFGNLDDHDRGLVRSAILSLERHTSGD